MYPIMPGGRISTALLTLPGAVIRVGQWAGVWGLRSLHHGWW